MLKFLLFSVLVHFIIISYAVLPNVNQIETIQGSNISSLKMEFIRPASNFNSTKKSNKDDKPQETLNNEKISTNQNKNSIKQKIQTELLRNFSYPQQAIRLGYQGTVLLNFNVTVDGKIENTYIKSSSTYRILDQSAVSNLNSLQLNVKPNKKINLTLPVIYKLDSVN